LKRIRAGLIGQQMAMIANDVPRCAFAGIPQRDQQRARCDA